MNRKMTFGRYDYASFLTFISYACCSMVVPMCLVPLSISLNFPQTEGGMGLGGFLQVARSVTMVTSMLLCGFIAARWGKRLTMGTALLLMCSGILISAFSPVYGVLFFGLLIAGFGEGVIEGLATPVVQDLHPDQPGRYLNFSHGFWSVGVLGMTLIAGALLFFTNINWRWIVGITGVTGMIPALIFLLPGKAKFPESDEKYNIREVAGKAVVILKTPRFWLFFAAMFFGGGGEFCLTFWCPTFIKIECDGNMWNAGIATACFAGGMIAGRLGPAYFVRQKKLKELIFYASLSGALITLPLIFVKSLIPLYIIFFFSGIMAGPLWPSIQSYCSTRINVDNTMLFILLSCAGVPGCGFFTLLMGELGDMVGLRRSFLLVPACFLIVVVLIGIDWIQGRQKIVNRHTRIKSNNL